MDDALEVLNGDSADRKQELIRELASEYGRICGYQILGNASCGFFERTDGLAPAIRQTGITSLTIILLNIVRFNSDTLAKPEFPGFLQRLKACCSNDIIYRDALAALLETEERLNLGNEFDTIKCEQGRKARSKKPHVLPLFNDLVDLPGSLSSEGKRHDNDSEAISDIAILPTAGEILSARKDFLPMNVVGAAHHLEGIQRVFDTQFRLLREDTTGPLRDAVRMVLDRWNTLANPPAEAGKKAMKKRTIQTEGGTFIRIYHNVAVSAIGFNYKGLSVVISFDQPAPVSGYAELDERKKWWEESKEFQEGSLLAMVNDKGEVTFLLISSRKVTIRQEDGSDPERTEYLAKDLASSQTRAAVTMSLADPSKTEDWQTIFNSVGEVYIQAVMVDFPGMLFAAFNPVLKCLQNLQRNPRMPFSKWIQLSSESEDQGDVLPPRFINNGTAPSPTLDLKCLAKDNFPLSFNILNPPTIQQLREHTTLDEGQSISLLSALQREIVLIQGPPGTGKSYVGIQLAKILWSNKDKLTLGPIICVCYTNHALDQFLEELLDAGISKIVRMGSRSKSERIQQECMNLWDLTRGAESTRTEKHNIWELRTKLEDVEQKMQDLCRKANNVYSDDVLKVHLLSNYPKLYQLFYPSDVDEDGWKKVRNKKSDAYRFPISTWAYASNARGISFPGGRQVSFDDLIALGDDVLRLAGPYRQFIYDTWVREMREEMAEEFLQHARKYLRLAEAKDICMKEKEKRTLERMDVIGVTTTGLATNSTLLRSLAAKVLICEEAAEVLEAHVLTALLPSVEHAILIGDHMQLRPTVANYSLSAESRQGALYRLDESLFERLAKPKSEGGGGMPVAQLDTQRRMFPSISELVRSTLYPKLKDYPSTAEYPPVVGMSKRLFWLDHKVFEDAIGGDDPTNTSKTNQWEAGMVVSLVRHILRQGVYQKKRVAVLTPYLGQLRILKKRLSAGYELLLDDRDQAELDLQDQLEEDAENEGGTPGVGTKDAAASDSQQVVKHGKLLDALRIATVDNFQGEEADIIIISLVRSNPKNNCGFLKTSNRINVLLSRARHGMYIIGNSETSKHVKMWADVIQILERGGNKGSALGLVCPRHPEKQIEVKTAEDFVRYSPEGGCDERCDKRLGCGHACIAKCHSVPMHENSKCMETCTRQHAVCGHSCPKKCHQPCGDCKDPVYNITLPCGHTLEQMFCSDSRRLETFPCPYKVQKKGAWCDHTITMGCGTDPKNVFCRVGLCGDHLPCGHTCSKRCGECRTAKTEGLSVEQKHPVCPQICAMLATKPVMREVTALRATNRAPFNVLIAGAPNPAQHRVPLVPRPVNGVVLTKKRHACSRALHPACPALCGEECPESAYCQLCASSEVLNQQVDMILFDTYGNTDVNEDPIIVLPCKHIFTMSTLDGHLRLSSCYELDQLGVPSKAKPFTVDPDSETIKGCPSCRGSLRSINRYNRIIKKAVLDESTKKFVSGAHAEYTKLCEAVQIFETKLKLNLDSQQTPFDAKIKHVTKHPDVVKLRTRLEVHQNMCTEAEQPYGKTRSLIVDAIRRRNIPDSFHVDETVIQTTCSLRARSLALQFHQVRVAGLREISLKPAVTPKHVTDIGQELANLANKYAKESRGLVVAAEQAMSHAIEVEARLFWAHFELLALHYPKDPKKKTGTQTQTENAEKTEKHRLATLDVQRASLESCLAKCDQYVGTLGKYKARAEKSLKMVNGEPFYTGVTDEERQAVYNAMNVEFRGSGHWYRCANGHPFTIGECGMPMELATCPECGAAVGGQGHTAVAGVTVDENMETAFRNMGI
ncbi:hypothetical protein DFS34DRAFT_685944 [Phlyctochytrium arcticum]|nr:hypothetical protein DFS34DRAFT_685944 [Phlyctochytrium arcticum]